MCDRVIYEGAEPQSRATLLSLIRSTGLRSLSNSFGSELSSSVHLSLQPVAGLLLGVLSRWLTRSLTRSSVSWQTSASRQAPAQRLQAWARPRTDKNLLALARASRLSGSRGHSQLGLSSTSHRRWVRRQTAVEPSAEVSVKLGPCTGPSGILTSVRSRTGSGQRSRRSRRPQASRFGGTLRVQPQSQAPQPSVEVRPHHVSSRAGETWRSHRILSARAS